jgi:hypothetical protein
MEKQGRSGGKREGKMTREQIGHVMRSGEFTKAEKQLLECQFPGHCHPGNFTEKLFDAIYAADENNQRRLALGFPDEVDAVQHWQHGGLREKMEAVANEAA